MFLFVLTQAAPVLTLKPLIKALEFIDRHPSGTLGAIGVVMALVPRLISLFFGESNGDQNLILDITNRCN